MLAGALVLALAGAALASTAGPKRKNLLFLVADDMRPELGAYGQKTAVTPNMDAFAESATVFTNSYCQFAICSASRNSFLSGRRPDRTRVWNFETDFRMAVGPKWQSFPQYLKDHGYTTLGAGKIYHPGHPPNNDEPLSWSQDKPYCKQAPRRCEGAEHELFCVVNVTEPGTPQDTEFNDYNMTQCAVENLEYASKKDAPFAIFLGLHFPHLSHRVPLWAVRKHMPKAGLFPNASGVIEPAKNGYAPHGMPLIEFTQEIDGMTNVSMQVNKAGETHEYQVPGPLGKVKNFPDWFQSNFRLGYRSAITLSDYHFGIVLDKLKELGHEDDTIVSIISDHGWKTGEHRMYAKHTNLELDARVTTMVRVPWADKSHGKRTSSLTELQDLFPTIVSLLGLPKPAQKIDGDDISAVFDDPTQQVKPYAFSQYDRCPEQDEPIYFHPNCEQVASDKIATMGYSVRDADWRYTAWYNWNGSALKADFSQKPIGEELYDHTGDTGVGDWELWENENVVSNPANGAVLARLRKALLDHYDVPSDDDITDDM